MADLKKQCAAKLKALLPNLDGVDKSDACYECKISRPTLDKYLRGDISKVDTATKLIEFFTGRVSDRIERVKHSNVA